MISKIPLGIQRLFPQFEFHIPTKEKVLYLTFDDGPVPEVTPLVLRILKHYNAKATFFCVGDNIRKHPDCFKQVLREGHKVGNHTMHHLQGIKVSTEQYIEDVAQCAGLCRSKLFRPPYGRLRPKQIRLLRKQGYRFILWSVISRDYNQRLSPTQCLDNSLKLSAGDILLLHDSIKAKHNMLHSLCGVMEHYHALGFRFEAIP